MKRKAVQFITNRVSIAELRKSEHGMALTSYVLQKAGYPEKARRLYAELKRMSITNGLLILNLFLYTLVLTFPTARVNGVAPSHCQPLQILN